MTEAEVIEALDTELGRFDNAGWDSGFSRSAFNTGEWLIAFEELYYSAIDITDPATVSEEMMSIKRHFKQNGVDFTELESAAANKSERLS